MYQRESYSFIHAVFMSLIFAKEILKNIKIFFLRCLEVFETYLEV